MTFYEILRLTVILFKDGKVASRISTDSNSCLPNPSSANSCSSYPPPHPDQMCIRDSPNTQCTGAVQSLYFSIPSSFLFSYVKILLEKDLADVRHIKYCIQACNVFSQLPVSSAYQLKLQISMDQGEPGLISASTAAIHILLDYLCRSKNCKLCPRSGIRVFELNSLVAASERRVSRTITTEQLPQN